MNTKKYLILAATALTLAACSNDGCDCGDGNSCNCSNNGKVAAQISASIAKTRAVDQNWNASDAIGVMVTNAPTSSMATMYKNVKYTVTAAGDKGKFTSTDGIYFQDASETVTFAAYYPYQTSTSIATLPGTDGTVTGGKTNEKNDTQANQETIDFLFASGATANESNPTVEFTGDDNQFKHKMTRLVLKVQMGNGFAASEISSITKITLGGLVHEGTFNVTDGTAAASTTVKALDDWDITNNYKTTADNVYTYTMILYPQTLTGALTFSATVAGEAYTNTTTIQPGLAAGTSYEYTITVNQTGLDVSGCTIAPWTTGTGGSGTATM